MLQSEGVPALLSGAPRYLRSLLRSSFSLERYVIFEFDTEVAQPPVPPPEIADLEVVIVEDEEGYRRLVAAGFEVPPFHPSFQPQWLRRGGVAFCAYVHRRLAHIGWVALSAEAKGCCDWLSYRVDFDHGEACWGGAHTWPSFRGLGLYTYVCGLRLQYMREHGFTRCRDAVRIDNVASLRGQAWWHPRPCLTGRFIRVLRWTSWREYPYEGARA